MKYPEWLSSALKDVEAITHIAAILLGGMWAYMKFIKGRLFYSRIEPTISAETLAQDSYRTLVISATIKNVGLSRVDIDHAGSAMRILAHKENFAPSQAVSAEWDLLGSFPVLEKHSWIEPGEPVREDRLIVLPKALPHNLLLELVVASSGIEWSGTCIVGLQPDKD